MNFESRIIMSNKGYERLEHRTSLLITCEIMQARATLHLSGTVYAYWSGQPCLVGVVGSNVARVSIIFFPRLDGLPFSPPPATVGMCWTTDKIYTDRYYIRGDDK